MIQLHHGHIQMPKSWPGCCQYIPQPDPHLHWSFQQLPVHQHSPLNLSCSNKYTMRLFIYNVRIGRFNNDSIRRTELTNIVKRQEYN